MPPPRSLDGMAAPLELRDAVGARLVQLGLAAPTELKLERPRNPDHGDWAVNCFPLAKGSSYAGPALGRRPGRQPERRPARPPGQGGGRRRLPQPPPPPDVAPRRAPPCGGRGHRRLRPIDDAGAGRSVNIEFVSANPTGPLHAAHGRWAAYGDSLARVLARTGWTVQREFYVNDRGAQLQRFGASLLAAKRGEPIPEDGYRGAYVEEWAAEMPDDADPVAWGRDRAIEDQRQTLAEHGRRLRPVVERDGARRRRRHGGHAGRAAPARPRVRRRRRRLAAHHRLRRRPRPRARAGQRRADVLPARHRLPPRQAGPGRPPHRHLGRRPPRLRGADEGRHPGAQPSARGPRDHHRPERRAAARRRGGQALEAQGRHHPAARGRHRRGGSRRHPLHLPHAVHRHEARLRPRRRRAAVDGQPGLLRADGPRPPGRHRPQRRRQGRRRASRSTPSTSACSPTTASTRSSPS